VNSHRAPRTGVGRTRAVTIVGAAAVLVTTASVLPILARDADGQSLLPVLSYETDAPPSASASPATATATTASAGPSRSPSPSAATATGAPQPTRASRSIPAPPTTNTPPGAPDDAKLVWSDEFTGASIDRAKWNVRDHEGRDIDKGCNVSSAKNSFVSGGNLTLRALRETATCSSQTCEYTQAYLDTIGKAPWTYGRFEIRAKSPNKAATSTGLWPAFWLRPDDGGNGEIDVTELPGGPSWYDRSTAAIFWDYTPVKQDTRIALPVAATRATVSTSTPPSGT
jgi:beta-glucanase (GH16 family)